MWRKLSPCLLCHTLVCLSILMGLCVLPAWGQMGSQGSVSVMVLDQSGAVVPGANLKLQDLATNDLRTAVTSTSGTYNFVGLSLGTYKLTVSKSGFETQVFDAVIVQAVRVTNVKVTLKVGAVTQEVVVSETAVPLIETTSNAISGTVDLKQIEQLPMTGRDVTQLAYLVPGFAGIPGLMIGTWNGLPLIATGSNIDGVQADTNREKFSAGTTPAVSARLEDIAEMTMQTDMLDLNTGFGSTGMQINFVTRRGTNAFHGRIYEDLRNDNLNANSWGLNATGIDRPEFKLNDFGGSLGGPIIKNKLFFFGSFAMSNQPGWGTAMAYFLSPAAQQGNFTFTDFDGNTQTINVLTDIAQPNGLPYTVNSAVSALLADINSGITAGKVTPNPGWSLDEVTWLVFSPMKQYFPAARIDYNISETFRLNFAFNQTKVNEPFAAAPPFPGATFANRVGTNRSNRYTTALGIDWSVTPNLMNQLRGGFLYYWYIYGETTEPLWPTEPMVQFPFGNSGTTYPSTNSRYFPLVNAADTLTWQKGGHTLKFGFSFYREQDHYWNPPFGYLNYTLGLVPDDPALSVFENSPLLANASTPSRAEAESLYAILVGRLRRVEAMFALNVETKEYFNTVGGYNLNELSKAWGLFFQDSYRVTPSLTLNYGLRWDFTGDNHDLTGAYHSATEEDMYGPSGLGNIFKPGTLTGDPNPTLKARMHHYNPWNVSPQPALGFAWNPNYTDGLKGNLFGGSSTVIRAGAALRRFTPSYQYFWNAASNVGYGFYQTFSITPSLAGEPGTFMPGSLALGDPLPPGRYSPTSYRDVIPQSEETFFGYWSGVNGMNPDIRQPYVMSWNFGIQRALNQSNVLEVRYVGNRSVHQWVTQHINEVNIIENGFLDEFKAAQTNLAINRAQPTPINSFANLGLPGQVDLPIMTDAGVSFTSGWFINYLQNGQAGDFATALAGSSFYLCNLIGGADFPPCGANPGSGYPINFFQANPFNAGKGSAWMTDVGWGNYHALQLDWRQKYWKGMQLNVNYTWSHTLGVQPNASWVGSFNMFTMRDLRLNYGPTLFDFRHVMHANGTYDLPFGKGKRFLNQGGALDKILGGWSIGTIVTYQSGPPFMLQGGYRTASGPFCSDGRCSTFLGDGGVNLIGITQADLQSSVGVYHTDLPFANVIGTQYLASPTGGGANAEYLAPHTTPGTIGYHPWLTGPRRFLQDLAITKAIPITERVRFTFQSQFLNVWNHPVWGTPSSYIQSYNFGQAGVGSEPRQIEFRANLEF